MEEQFYQITKHPSTLRIKSGLDKDNRITARRCEVFWNGGAYADVGPRVTQKSGFVAAGPYDIENVWIDSYALYTHTTPSGALRGFRSAAARVGSTRAIPIWWQACSSSIRSIFRRKNLLHEGRPHASGTILKDAPIEAVLDQVCERMRWQAIFERGKGSVAPRARTRRRAEGRDLADDFCCRAQRSGRWQRHSLLRHDRHGTRLRHREWRRWWAELLNISAETVKVVQRDTDVTPYDMGTLGSRSLFHMGHAVRLAAEEVRSKLRALAREVGEPEGSNISISDLFKKKYGMQAGNIVGSGTYKPDYTPAAAGTGQSTNVTPFWMVGGAGAEVEVDTETGHVRIAKVVNVIDCGKQINPRIVETQISGASIMQLGFTMFENMHLDGGQVTNASLADYKIPGMLGRPSPHGE